MTLQWCGEELRGMMAKDEKEGNSFFGNRLFVKRGNLREKVE